MKIQVLGSGCTSCKMLYEITQMAVAEMKLDAQVEYITGNEGIQKIIEMGVMSSPVLAIEDKPLMTGFTPDIEEVKKIIQENI